jgi:Plavaka transposase
MNTRCCLECGKGVKSLSGLSRHMYKCPVVTGKRTSITKNTRAEIRQYSSQSDSDKQRNDNSHQQRDDHSYEQRDSNSHEQSDSEWIDLNEDTISGQSRLSTTASIRIDSYEEVTGKKAGQIFDDFDILNCDSKSQSPRRSPEHSSRYYPFQSETDFAFAQWLLSAKCTKGDIDRFYGDMRLGQIHKLLSFSSHHELLSKIHDIPYGIPDDIWNITEIQVEQDTIGLPPHTYQIRYRNIKSVLEFLMGHGPFEHHLSYAPVRQFCGTSSDNQIYDEMHTGNWWWRTQGEIPDGGTIIPVLLASDKTMLSLHHGDQSAWPIYVTIGNLDRQTRHSQMVPGSVLLGFLPITSEIADESKSHVYHAAMGLILKCQ